MKKGLVQIYTGNGKGKTTAAMGLALRAAGAGIRVSICQFIKGKDYSEIKALKKIKNINLWQCGRGCFIRKKPSRKDMDCARKGFVRARKTIMSGRYGLVVLDEINIALNLGLIELRDVVDLIARKPSSVELVLTGRYCPKALFKHAGLVTEMKEVRHPYKEGIKARRGIEF